MTREERCKLAIERGFSYDAETGDIFNRYGKKSKPNKSNGYHEICITVNKKSFKIQGHQFAWYYEYRDCVAELDHINGLRHDNRICNLRSVTKQQNQWNRLTAKGYYWNKKLNKWQSKIKVNKKNITLGCFDTEEKARNAYLEAKQKYHVI
jgi:hypothetical protein